MMLGHARRKLGQKRGEWTAELNQKLFARLDSNGDGRVSADEFAQYFDRSLPHDPTEFERTIEQFMAVAIECKAQIKS